MLTWFTPGRAGVATTNGIVRAHEVGTVMEIVELLRQARHERDAILADAGEEAVKTVNAAQCDADGVLARARQTASELVADAQQRALAEVERGYADGQRRAAAQWHEHHARLLAAQDKGMSAPEQKLAEIVVMAVQRIIHSEPREALWRRALQTVQELMQRRGTVTLRVCAADADLARAAVAGWPAGAPSNGLSVEVRSDPTLAQGSCVFESELGTLDASLDIQLAGMRTALARAVTAALASRDGDGGEDDMDRDPFAAASATVKANDVDESDAKDAFDVDDYDEEDDEGDEEGDEEEDEDEDEDEEEEDEEDEEDDDYEDDVDDDIATSHSDDHDDEDNTP